MNGILGTPPIETLPILLGAIVLDLLLGEPPNALHPVAWIGRAIDGLTRGRPHSGSAAPFAYGLLVVALCVGTSAGIGWLIAHLLGSLPLWPRIVAGSVVAKPFFAIRALPAAANSVGGALGRGDLAAAQDALLALVSRDRRLPESLVVSAAIESVAENFCDSVVAPILFFALLGLPGLIAYRTANTLDAMIGYRGEFEWYGKAAARFDDLLNLVPGRLAGLLLCAGAFLAKGRALAAARAWKTMLAQRGVVESPNAGWGMAAMAGALAATLEKPGHYRLAGGPDLPTADDIATANRIYAAAVGLLVLLIGIAWGIESWIAF